MQADDIRLRDIVEREGKEKIIKMRTRRGTSNYKRFPRWLCVHAWLTAAGDAVGPIHEAEDTETLKGAAREAAPCVQSLFGSAK